MKLLNHLSGATHAHTHTYPHHFNSHFPGDLGQLVAPLIYILQDFLVSEMTYTVSSGTLISSIPYHTISKFSYAVHPFNTDITAVSERDFYIWPYTNIRLYQWLSTNTNINNEN